MQHESRNHQNFDPSSEESPAVREFPVLRWRVSFWEGTPVMDWLNIHHTVLNSEEYIDSEPTARATWLNLMGYCAVQENGGRVVGVRQWKDRKCQQILRVTREELDDDSALWRWEGDDIVVHFYPVDKEELVKARREAGRSGGSRSTDAKKGAAQAREQAKHKQPPQANHKQTTSKSTTEEEGKRKGKGRGKEVPDSYTASGDAENTPPRHYLTRKKRKLTGKRLESFEAFWQAFAYPKGKAEAADAWLDIPELTNGLVARICSAARQEAAERPKLLAAGQTPKYAQGWLTSKRWEDYEQDALNGSHAPRDGPAGWREARDAILTDPEAPDALKARLRDAEDWFGLADNIRARVRERMNDQEEARRQ